MLLGGEAGNAAVVARARANSGRAEQTGPRARRSSRGEAWKDSSGELLAARPPAHYLDYFHCSLLPSPDSQWLADNGWVWHPVGIVRTWSAARWLGENPYESEDGASVRALCWRDYRWDSPLCWLDDHTLAVWGYGTEDRALLPAARLFDVRSGSELRWFPGPRGELFSDGRYLFASEAASGTTVWDPATGERLLHDPALHATHLHRASGVLLSALEDGSFEAARLAGSSL